MHLQKLSALAVGSAGGVVLYMYATQDERRRFVAASWTTNSKPSKCAVWDYNWDRREPTSLVEPLGHHPTPDDENKYRASLEKTKSKATRHIILVRHGEYLDKCLVEADRVLTPVGRQQANYTGQRLAQLNIKWDKMVVSTQVRAQETAEIIAQSLRSVPVEHCSLIREGAPIPPEPPVNHWKPEPAQFYRDGARIEAAFRKYFYRAEADQKEHSYTLLVGHGNVIRYFTCRALQFPPEAWLRISLNHGSITWISILPSGRVTLRTLGDSGHIPPELITHK